MTTVSTTPGPAAIGSDDKELISGQEVGEYRIEGVLGRGGFGTVYGAVQPVIGKRVAIKVLSRKYAADQDIVSRFAAEARAVNQIRHRNIIDIFSFGQLPDGRHYYVMEYLDGEPLDSHLRTYGAMALEEAIPILRAIARALDAAHAKGIAHRDLKPENIFLANDPDGGVYPKLLDFGIAKLLAPEETTMHRTGTGVPIGTPYYMSPEQCRGRDVDHRTDIYSFGIVVYRMLTGALPFEAPDYVELLYKQVSEEPALPSRVNPKLPESVDIAIAWMMQKDREKRPKTVLEGVNALDPANPMRPTPLPRSHRPSVGPTGATGRPQQTPSEIAFAETGVSSPNANAATGAQTSAPPNPRGTRITMVIVAGLVVAGIGVGVYMKTRPPHVTVVERDKGPTGSAVPAQEPPHEPVKQPIAEPADAAATPETVMLELTGAPEGTEVLRDGKLIGVVPKVPLPYSTKVQYLVLQADGFQPLPITVLPDQDRRMAVKLKPKKRAGGSRPSHDDVEDPFKKAD
ncbi:MAG TPA: protein kinase [Kofleriaceae bacterium]|nr:protein kinase [Kofleriaceae bacterium]